MATTTNYLRSGSTGTPIDGSTWDRAWRDLATAITNTLTGGTIYVAHDHNENSATGQTFAFTGSLTAPMKLLCHTYNVAPSAATLTTGAVIAQSLASTQMTITTQLYAYGVTFRNGAGQSTACNIVFGSGGGQTFQLENCRVELASTGGNNRITFNNGAMVIWSAGTAIKFGNAAAGLNLGGGALHWRDGVLDATGTTPTNLLIAASTGFFRFERIDFTALNSANQLIGTANVVAINFTIKDCRFGPNFTPGNWSHVDGGFGIISRSGSSTSHDNLIQNYEGQMSTNVLSTVIARQSGASLDNALPVSWQVAVGTNNHLYQRNARTPDIELYNTLTGAGHTATIYCMANGAALPKNDELWLECAYLGDSSSPLKTMVSSFMTNVLATSAAYSADTSGWQNGSVPLRVNSTAYTVGQAIRLNSNASRVFFCTTAGNSGSAEPAGYASAVDGGTVNESTGGTGGTAVFRAGVRFKMSVTFGTIDRPGFIIGWVRFGGAVATSLFIDPQLTVA